MKITAPDGGAVTGDALKRIPLPSIMQRALANEMWQQHSTDPVHRISAADPEKMQERYPKAAPRQRQGRRLSDAFLKRIVKRYREIAAEGGAPTKGIAQEEIADDTMVRRWLQEAERRKGIDFDHSERLDAAAGGRLR